MQARINRKEVYRQFPALPQGLGLIGEAVKHTQLDPKLINLLEIRSSQINRCGFCLDMHINETLKLGENRQRLDVLPAWREVPWFSDKEKAALNWCERLTNLNNNQVTDADFEQMQQYFTDLEIIAITAAVIKINSWNRVVAAMHFVPSRQDQAT